MPKCSYKHYHNNNAKTQKYNPSTPKNNKITPVTFITLKTLIFLITLITLRALVTRTTLIIQVHQNNPSNAYKHNKPKMTYLALVWKSFTGQRELRIWSESMTGKKELDWRQKQPEIGRKWDYC
jgi:hypothetical protein